MIRPATPDDCPAIAAIWNPVIRDTLITFTTAEKTPEGLAATLAEKEAAGYAFLVAEEEGRILGFATYGQFRAGPGYARTLEHTVVLAPDCRGRGVGRALMAAVEDHARAGGARSVFAGVSAANPEGRAFHAALGYRETAVLRDVGYKFDRWLDLVLMQKFL
ncbi:N-acetyltransferase family protein [Ostreiculturibacter nitratireducens]|uniref:GNAT family N-acetyltransferase n=1 Tax=Ostreiculturibacter nitratireducens TaxID=3075226 RepID=UPI0031B5BD90